MRTVWEYAGADGGAVLVRLYGAEGRARLPERLGGLPLTAVGPYCFSGEEIPPRFRRQDVKRCEAGEAFLEGEEPAPLRGGGGDGPDSKETAWGMWGELVLRRGGV